MKRTALLTIAALLLGTTLAYAEAMPRIIHISDLHFSDSSTTLDGGYYIDNQNSRLKSGVLSDFLINNKAQLRANIIVITGDLTDSGDVGDYLIAQAFVRKLKDKGFEVYCVPGNHDCSKEGNLMFGQHENSGKETRRDNFSKYVDDSVFPRLVDLHGGWLILLDSLQGELAPPGKDNCAQGFLGEPQRARLQSYIDSLQAERRAGKKVIVCLHHSPFAVPEGDLPPDKSLWIYPQGGLSDAREFLSIVGNKIDCLLFGHTSGMGRLQEGHGSFAVQRKVYGIPMINCENLEHLPWYQEEELSGAARQVCVAANQDGRLQVFYIGTDSHIYDNWQVAPNGGWNGDRPPDGHTNGGWHGETALGGRAKQLCVGQNQDGRLEIFYIGINFKIYHNWQMAPGGGWHGDVRLGPRSFPGRDDIGQQICVGRNQDGRLEVFYIGTNFNVYHNWQTTPGGDWHGEEALDGQGKQICVEQNLDGRLEIFYVGTSTKIYHNWQTTPNGAWHGETPLGAHSFPSTDDDTAQQICVARNNDGRLEVFYVGTDGEIFHNWQSAPNGASPNGTSPNEAWHGEERLGRFLENTGFQISAGQNKDGRIEIFYAGANSLVYHNYQGSPDGAWVGAETLRGLTASAQQICTGRNLDGRLEIFYVGPRLGLFHNFQTIPNAAYPITVIDMDHYEREVYHTDSPIPASVTTERLD